ncbi:dTDP-4-dehydrorhamnose reductase [Candidatus Omnitrophota bacterium]
MGETKVLITGSRGMLGLVLVEALSSGYAVKKIDIDNCDITKREDTLKTIKDYQPDFIIHTAAYTDVDGCELNQKQAFAANAAGTENVAQAAKASGAVLFYISTDYVFDGTKDRPYAEQDKPHPVNIYGESKLEGEKIIQSLLSKYFILRTSWLFGPGGKNFVTSILKACREKETLEVVSDQAGSPTYTLDLAEAIISLLAGRCWQTADKFGIYHITNSGSCSWYEFAKRIIALKKLKTKILPISSSESRRPAPRPKMSILDNSKLISTFKLSLRPWPEALNHFLLNYEKN